MTFMTFNIILTVFTGVSALLMLACLGMSLSLSKKAKRKD